MSGLALASMSITLAAEAAKECEKECKSAAAATVSVAKECEKECKSAKVATVAAAKKCEKECKGAAVATVAAAKECEKECKGAAFATVAAAKECKSAEVATSCPVGKAIADLPQINVKYVVGRREFSCPTAAKDAHIEAVETFVASFSAIHTCEASGKTFVGNKGYECGTHAQTIVTIAKEAMDEVATVHLVGEKEFCCPTAAGVAAEKQGAKVTYAVAGEKTQCAKTNRLNLAVAKYKAAVLAIAKAESAE